MTVDYIKLRLAVVTSEFETGITIKTAIDQNRFLIRITGPIMPDAGRACIGKEATVFSPGPSARAIKIDASFHDTVLKIKHAICSIPWTHCITGICAKMTIDRF